MLCMAPKRQNPQKKRRKRRRSLFTHARMVAGTERRRRERPGPNLISRLSDGQKGTEERGRAGKQGPEKDVGSALSSSSSERTFLNLRCFPFFRGKEKKSLGPSITSKIFFALGGDFALWRDETVSRHSS